MAMTGKPLLEEVEALSEENWSEYDQVQLMDILKTTREAHVMSERTIGKVVKELRSRTTSNAISRITGVTASAQLRYMSVYDEHRTVNDTKARGAEFRRLIEAGLTPKQISVVYKEPLYLIERLLKREAENGKGSKV